MDNELKIESFAKLPNLFAARMSSSQVKYGGISFSIESLDNTIATYISGMCIESDGTLNQGALIYWTNRYGIRDVSGLITREGEAVPFEMEKVKVLGREYDRMTAGFYDRLPPEILPVLYYEINKLSALTDEELDKVDFTMASLSEE